MRILKRAAVATAFAALLMAPAAHAVPNLGHAVFGGGFYAAGGNVTITFLYNDAGNNNRLFAYIGAVMMAEFNIPSGTNTGTPASVTFAAAANDRIDFLLCTTGDPGNGVPQCSTETEGGQSLYTGWWSGPGTAGPDGPGNSDGNIHVARVTAQFWNDEVDALEADAQKAPAGTLVFGFEDLSLGDADYNDTVFSIDGVSVVPEPATMVLLATGLIGLAGAGAVRRRKDRK